MKAEKKKAREELDIVNVIEWRKCRSAGARERWFLLVRRPEGGESSRVNTGSTASRLKTRRRRSAGPLPRMRVAATFKQLRAPSPIHTTSVCIGFASKLLLSADSCICFRDGLPFRTSRRAARVSHRRERARDHVTSCPGQDGGHAPVHARRLAAPCEFQFSVAIASCFQRTQTIRLGGRTRHRTEPDHTPPATRG